MIDLTTEDIFKNRNLFRINHYSPSILKKAYICLLSGKPFFFLDEQVVYFEIT